MQLIEREPIALKVSPATQRGLFRVLLATAILTLCVTQVNAAPFAYVTNAFSSSVSVVDTATNQVSATITFPAGSGPYAAAITPDLKKVYVTSMDLGSTCGPNNAVFVIDTSSNTVGANPIAVGCEPTSISITPDGTHAYVANQFDSTVSVIDTTADAVTQTIVFPRAATLASIAISPDGQRAYVTALGLDILYLIDTKTNILLSTMVAIAGSASGVAVSPDGKEAYVTSVDLAGSVSVIDTGANAVVATIPNLAYPAAVTFTPNGKYAYVGVNTGTVVIDTMTRGIVATIAQGGTSIAVTADGAQAYAANEGANATYVIDTATSMVTATISGMSSPRGVTARPLPPGIPVPNVVGVTQGAATTAITGVHLTVGTVTPQLSTTVALGTVISQIPPPGTLLGSNAAVDLVVSSGVSVPDVSGQTEAAATAAITNAGLVLGTVTSQTSSTVTPGNVISESPAAGTMVSGGSKVDLVVSLSPVDSPHGGSGGGGALDAFTFSLLLGALVLRMRRRWGQKQGWARFP
jgi:YVTN family beta-propeller protein